MLEWEMQRNNSRIETEPLKNWKWKSEPSFENQRGRDKKQEFRTREEGNINSI